MEIHAGNPEQGEQIFRATFDNAAVGIAHVGLDGSWLKINDKLGRILGYSQEELLTKTFADLTHPDDLDADWAQAHRLIQGEIETYSMEKRYFRKDGSVVWAELTVSMIRDPENKPVAFISVVEDITGRRAIEQSLRESEDHYRFMVDSNPAAPWTADPRGRITDFSDRWLQMTGLTMGEELAGTWVKVIHPEDLPGMVKAWTHSLITLEKYDVEHRTRLTDGTYRWMRSRAVPRLDAEGKILRWYGSTEDIQAQKMAAVELERLVEERTAQLSAANQELVRARDEALAAARAKSQFLANMSHEIRTPMNGVVGLTSLLLSRDLDAETKELVETIGSSGHTLLRIIDDVLDLSKIDAGQFEIVNARVEVSELVSDIVSLFQAHAQAKRIELRCQAPSAPIPDVMIDPVRVRQVLSNLISNAIKFTHEGSVVVRYRYEVERLHFEVADTGVGIPEDRQEAIFERFTQVDGSIQRQYGGTGLGLTISRKLVEMMGGHLRVKSELRNGTTFSVDIPAPRSEETTETFFKPIPETEAVQLPRRRLHILLAEDNAVNVVVATKLLSKCECDVDVAENGLRAIAMSRARTYDLVLMDVQMPVCDGIEAARAIRVIEEREGRPRLPIFALTANALGADRSTCLEAGMDGFLAKPITYPILQSFIDSAYSLI